MAPIVDGLEQDYRNCLEIEKVNFHANTPWHARISPLGAPEFALLDEEGKIAYRWLGVTDRGQFDDVLQTLCTEAGE